jgi:thymidylate kinase
VNGAGSDRPLLRRLCEELSARDVLWRPRVTGSAPEHAVNGTGALDILVRSEDTPRCVEILNGLGFKEARPPATSQRPGAGHYYGYDGQADCIVRVSVSFHSGIGDVSEEIPPVGSGRGRMALVSGGALIAVVGADGAGKTTALEALHRWLSPHFRVVKIHMGKPRWSWITFPVKGLLKIGRWAEILTRGRAPEGDASLEGAGVLRRLAWRTVTARDRYLASRRARRIAARGALVLCDRFPLPEIRTMDGRSDGRLSAAARTRPARLLAGLEERYYAAITRPDLLLVLSVRPELALERRPEDPEDRVRLRAREVLEVDWAAVGAHVVDAERPDHEVHRDMKAWIWARL